MRLLDTTSLDVVSFLADKIPPYAILSHTWGAEHDEPTLQQIQELTAAGRRDPAAWNRHPIALKKGYLKIRAACSLALSQSYRYIWIDTCCIDKTSSAELSEAINSMYRWYEGAGACYAFLEDVDVGPGIVNPDISRCRWFTRAWTLPELVAPANVYFYDYKWSFIGSKRDRVDFREQLSRTTGVDGRILSGVMQLDELSIACRMAWAASRTTTRVEDMAYCLMGIFGVNMPLLYGEGSRAFVRLQEEILRSVDDHSLFAWKYPEGDPLSRQLSGLLASSPKYFRETGHIGPSSPNMLRKAAPSGITNAGLHVQFHLRPVSFNSGESAIGCAQPSQFDSEAHTDFVAMLDCVTFMVNKEEHCHGLRLVALGSGQFARIQSDHLLSFQPPENEVLADKGWTGDYRYVYVKQKPAWVFPDIVVESLGVKDCEVPYSLVEVYPSSRWDRNSRTLRSRHSQHEHVLGGFRYRVAKTSEKLVYIDVLVLVGRIEGQLGNWVAANVCSDVESGKTLQQAFNEMSKEDCAKYLTPSAVNGYQPHQRILNHGLTASLEKSKRRDQITFTLKLSEDRPEYWSELAGKEVFGSGKIITTANLLKNRAEMDHLLALTRRMACEVVDDSLDITFTQNVNLVLAAPSKIRARRLDASAEKLSAKTELPVILEMVKRLSHNILVDGKDGGKLGILEQYFADRLVAACIQGDEPTVRQLVQTKLVAVCLESKVSGQSLGGDSILYKVFLAFRPIHWAAVFGATEIVRLLTENGADRYSKTVTGFTTVHLAAMMGHTDLVDYLLKSWELSELLDLDRLRKGQLNEPPAHLAAAYDRMDKGQSLLRSEILAKDAEGRARTNDVRNGLGETPLHRAAAMDNVEAISAIADFLTGDTMGVNCPDGYGRTPLWHAAATGSDGAVRHLLELAAEVDSLDVYGRTPLHIACREGEGKVARMLLEAGADVNRLTTAPCLSACHFAALAADIECLQLVIEYGGKPDLRSVEGLELGAIHIAAANGWLDGVRLLVEKGCDPITPCSHLVTSRGHSSRDAGVNVARFHFNNARELALRGGHGEVVEYLKDLAQSAKLDD